MKRGEFWLVDISGGTGCEQQGLRPCLIVQNDIGNKYAKTTIVCPATRKLKNFNATHVLVEGLDNPSYVMCEQVRVVAKERVKHFICEITAEEMREVDKKLRIALAI